MGENLYGLYQTRPEYAKMYLKVGGSQSQIGIVPHHAGIGHESDIMKRWRALKTSDTAEASQNKTVSATLPGELQVSKCDDSLILSTGFT